jgi:hypothetical protein
MPGAFLYDNAIAAASLSSPIIGGSIGGGIGGILGPAGDQANVPTMPLQNLQDAQPRRRARLNASSATIYADFNSERSVDCVALISTTLGAGATVRARVGSQEALVEAAPVVALDFMQAVPSSMAAWSAARGGGGGAGEATYFGADGLLKIATAGEWRIDHMPGTGIRRGVLLEPGRTNAALQAQDFTQAAWVKTNITAARDVVDLRGLANTASRLTATANNATVLQSITAASAARVTSFYLRRITGTGTVEITQNGGTNWTALTLTGDWQRFSIPFAIITNPQIGIRIGTSGDVVAVDAAQCEIGTFPTSPILSEGTALTRQADGGTIAISATDRATLFTDCFHEAHRSDGVVSVGSNIQIDDGGTSLIRNRLIAPSNTTDALVRALNVDVADFNGGFISLPAASLQAIAYAANDMAYSQNGGAAETDTSGVLPDLTRVAIIQSEAITYLRRLRAYSDRLSNAQLVALTATGSSLVASQVTGDTGTIAAEAEAANQGNVIMTLPAPALGRILRIDIENPTATFTDIGVLAAGQLWRTERSIAYGIDEGRLMLDRRDRNAFTGAEFPVPAVINPRYARFTLPVLSDNEVRTQHRELVRQLGAARDGLVIPDIADGLAERNRRALWGALNEPGTNAGTVLTSFNVNERSFTVTERV